MVFNNCICDELPPNKQTSLIKPTGTFKEYVCTCRRMTGIERRKTYWADYNGVEHLTCAVCNKLREVVRKCRICNDLYIYVGRPMLCNHYPNICRDCLSGGTCPRWGDSKDDDILSVARSGRGLSYKARTFSRQLSIDDLLKGL